MAHHSEHYTHGHHDSVLKSHRWRTVENSAAHVLPHLREGMSILDVGSGPGTITVDFAQRVAPGRVVGVDASAQVVEKARALAAETGVENVEFVVGDAYALEFDDEEFDLVHTHQTLHHVGNPIAVLREMRRVAKPDGLVAAREVDYAGTIWHPQLSGLEQWMTLYQAVHRSNSGEPDAGRALKAWALEAGFSEVVASASVWCFTSEQEREWWGGMWEERVLQSAFAVDAIDKHLASQDELIDISRAWREWANDPAGWLAMPHGEVLCRG